MLRHIEKTVTGGNLPAKVRIIEGVPGLRINVRIGKPKGQILDRGATYIKLKPLTLRLAKGRQREGARVVDDKNPILLNPEERKRRV